MLAILQAAMTWSSAAVSCEETPDPLDYGHEEHSSLESLFEALEHPLLLYALKLTQDRNVAEDLVQEAFCRICPHLSQLDQPRPWLFRTVFNLAMSHHRARKKWLTSPGAKNTNIDEGDSEDWLSRAEEDPASPFIASGSFSPDQALEREEAYEIIRISMEILDSRSREALRLKFEENYSYKQIAEALGITSSNVGYILHHALKTLAIELQRFGLKPH